MRRSVPIVADAVLLAGLEGYYFLLESEIDTVNLQPASVSLCLCGP